MIKYNLKTLISDKELAEDRKITYRVISEKTGISKTTLSKIATVEGYKASADVIEKLCLYFQCTPNDFMT
ncbi:MAG: helix-turn-helix transcriptional regulator, partial [Desulfobacterales bacterium]